MTSASESAVMSPRHSSSFVIPASPVLWMVICRLVAGSGGLAGFDRGRAVGAAPNALRRSAGRPRWLQSSSPEVWVRSSRPGPLPTTGPSTGAVLDCSLAERRQSLWGSCSQPRWGSVRWPRWQACFGSPLASRFATWRDTRRGRKRHWPPSLWPWAFRLPSSSPPPPHSTQPRPATLPTTSFSSGETSTVLRA